MASGDLAAARSTFSRALTLAGTDAERAFIERRLAKIAPGGDV